MIDLTTDKITLTKAIYDELSPSQRRRWIGELSNTELGMKVPILDKALRVWWHTPDPGRKFMLTRMGNMAFGNAKIKAMVVHVNTIITPSALTRLQNRFTNPFYITPNIISAPGVSTTNSTIHLYSEKDYVFLTLCGNDLNSLLDNFTG